MSNAAYEDTDLGIDATFADSGRMHQYDQGQSNAMEGVMAWGDVGGGQHTGSSAFSSYFVFL